MYSFKNDYSEGCHPLILQNLSSSNLEQITGYGEDKYSMHAKILIRKELNDKDAEIHFVTGGTQANLLISALALKSYESIICADTGHIHLHEAGAIEATGHKINTITTTDGKLNCEQIQKVLDEHSTTPHMVVPKMVYISNATEVGTIYKKAELESLYTFCKSKNLYLFVDVARLGSALTALTNDVKLSDLAHLSDVFYIGGTKNGALFGEAIVINNKNLKQELGFHLKQRGALLAKGRTLGIQFYTLFTDQLFFNLAKYSNAMANKMSKVFLELGYAFYTKPESNQLFPILSNAMVDALSNKYEFYIWSKINEDALVIRLVTSWATPEEIVNTFIHDLKSMDKNLKNHF